ncbi:5-methyltetrahydropteroyltriglutamate-- homocysteine methyltransferase, partial [Haemophilus influenzae]
LSKLIQHIM